MANEPAYIVVGVDGTPQSDAALEFALDEAGRSGDAVRVVTAWMTSLPVVSVPMMPMAGTPFSEDELEAAAASVQRTALERVADAAARVEVTTQVVEGDAAHVLVEASRDARLLVVGSRALGPFRAALLGSVSRHVAQHAGCPVVVVPGHPQRGTTRAAESPSAAGGG